MHLALGVDVVMATYLGSALFYCASDLGRNALALTLRETGGQSVGERATS